MKQDDKKFFRLLPLDELYSLYSRVGDSINTDIDLLNANYDYLAKDNSIQLLIDLSLISKSENTFLKSSKLDSMQAFSTDLIKRIHDCYSDVLEIIESANTNYDESRGVFFGYRNDIPLDYSGILMLLSELGYLELSNSCFYTIQQDHIIRMPEKKQKTAPITLINLENSLLFKKNIGEEAEQEVLLYEQKLLDQQEINKIPIQVSHLDASAGYDIASFLSSVSEVPDKFIEVKSCNKDETFYISKNEIETARKKGDNYYLYLYNRETKTIRIIQNPYENIIQKDEWIKDPQIIRIKQI